MINKTQDAASLPADGQDGDQLVKSDVTIYAFSFKISAMYPSLKVK